MKLTVTWFCISGCCIQQLSDFVTDAVFTMSYDPDEYPSLNCAIHGGEIQLSCYISNSRIVENENGSVT